MEVIEEKKGEGSLIGLLCSRNARPKKGLVGRAQWETDSGHPPGEDTSELGGGGERGLVVLLLAERAR